MSCESSKLIPRSQNTVTPDNRCSILSELIFEQIKDNYWYATYGPFRVVMNKSNGYINATKLCSAGAKNYCNWSRLKGNDQVVILLQKQLEKQNSNLALGDANQQICGLAPSACISIKTGNKSPADQVISGTYCHPELVKL